MSCPSKYGKQMPDVIIKCAAKLSVRLIGSILIFFAQKSTKAKGLRNFLRINDNNDNKNDNYSQL